METTSAGGGNRLWAVPGIPGITLLQASFQHQRFPRHVHDHHVIGLSEGRFRAILAGREHEFGPGPRINVIPAGVVHTGECVGDHVWGWRAFYVAGWRLEELQSELTGRPPSPPLPAAFADDWLGERLAAAHRAMTAADVLRGEALAIEAVSQVLVRSRRSSLQSPAPHEPEAVRSARDYLLAHPAEKTTLSALAERVGIGPFRLLRAFQRAYGVAPHTFQMGLRVERARALISHGMPLAQAALEAGFADQSHLTRQFKRFVGVTPGGFARGIAADSRD